MHELKKASSLFECSYFLVSAHASGSLGIERKKRTCMYLPSLQHLYVNPSSAARGGDRSHCVSREIGSERERCLAGRKVATATVNIAGIVVKKGGGRSWLIGITETPADTFCELRYKHSTLRGEKS